MWHVILKIKVLYSLFLFPENKRVTAFFKTPEMCYLCTPHKVTADVYVYPRESNKMGRVSVWQ